MADTWWVVIPAVDKGKATSYLELVDFRVSYPPGSPGDKAMRSGQAYNDPNLGQSVVKWQGPFPSEAAAKTAQAPKQQSPNPVSDLATAAENASGGPLSGLAAIGAFFNKLGQGSTWIRVGEVMLGLILLAVGAARITGTQNVISSAVKARI